MIHQRLLHLCPSKDLPVAAYHSVVQSENHSLPQDRVIVTSVVLLCMQRYSAMQYSSPLRSIQGTVSPLPCMNHQLKVPERETSRTPVREKKSLLRRGCPNSSGNRIHLPNTLVILIIEEFCSCFILALSLSGVLFMIILSRYNIQVYILVYYNTLYSSRNREGQPSWKEI